MRSKFLEDIRFELKNVHGGEQKMDIIKLLEFSGETPDGDVRPWYGVDD